MEMDMAKNEAVSRRNSLRMVEGNNATTAYLEAYDEEEAAARAYALAAIRYWGTSTFTKLPVRSY